jgi:hypothetical protein
MHDPALQPGETLVARQPDVGLAVYKSGINYRMAPSLPLLQAVGFFITDRRAILRGELFMNLYDRDVDFWFPGSAPGADAETITRVSTERVEPLGGCLRIETFADRDHLLRKKAAVFQIFTPEALNLLAHFPAALRKS